MSDLTSCFIKVVLSCDVRPDFLFYQGGSRQWKLLSKTSAKCPQIFFQNIFVNYGTKLYVIMQKYNIAQLRLLNY